MEEALAKLGRLVSRMAESSFEELAPYCRDRVEEAAWFMGLMEMVHQGKVTISQTVPTANIVIRHEGSPAWSGAAGGKAI